MSGRPLRFIGTALLVWTGVRVFMLWPQAVSEPIRELVLPKAVAASDLPETKVAPTAGVDQPRRFVVLARTANRTPTSVSAPSLPLPVRSRSPGADGTDLAIFAAMPDAPPVLDIGAPQLTSPVPGALTKPRPSGSRWSASSWLLLRDGQSALPGLGGGQLGGGQGGVRIAYELGNARRVALVGRVVSPVSGKGREAALGVEWRPTKLPLRLVVEQRFSLDGGKGGPVVGIVGGTGPARLFGGLDLETYGQAGIIRRDRTEPFAEGAARLTRGVMRLGKTKLDLGLGAWGGAQREAQRLDIGPTIGMRLPIAKSTVRISADWRQRIAGHARPASGPALTIGGDF